ncbi:hypothetical protein BLOT_004554 [Blomia tropicalis]|nr:hypothetical protein BLOT_004554 [Blomia tropicalis]
MVIDVKYKVDKTINSFDVHRWEDIGIIGKICEHLVRRLLHPNPRLSSSRSPNLVRAIFELN